MFDIEDHYGAHLKKETIRKLTQPFVMDNRSITFTRKKQNASSRTDMSGVRHSDFIEINKMCVEYLSKLKKSMNPSAFAAKIYMCELTGASVKVHGGATGIIVEERMNSIIVVSEDDRVRTYLKRTNDFIISHDGVDYVLIGSGMKINRFGKK